MERFRTPSWRRSTPPSRAGEPSPLPDLPVQYADFAAWQRRWLRGERAGGAAGVLEADAGRARPRVRLPLDRPPPAHAGAGGRRRTSSPLPRALAERVRALGRGARAPRSYMTLPGRLRRAAPRAGRGRPTWWWAPPWPGAAAAELEAMIGFFVNALALRLDAGGDPGFRELLRRVRETTLEAYAHQDVPFEKVLEAVKVERHLNMHPLTQVMFTLQHEAPLPPGTSGLAIQPTDEGGDTGTAKADLLLGIVRGEEGLRCALEYASALFERTTIERVAGHYRALLEHVASDPDAPLSALLPGLEAHPAPEAAPAAEPPRPVEHAPAASRLEESIAAIWREVLGAARVGRERQLLRARRPLAAAGDAAGEAGGAAGPRGDAGGALPLPDGALVRGVRAEGTGDRGQGTAGRGRVRAGGRRRPEARGRAARRGSWRGAQGGGGAEAVERLRLGWSDGDRCAPAGPPPTPRPLSPTAGRGVTEGRGWRQGRLFRPAERAVRTHRAGHGSPRPPTPPGTGGVALSGAGEGLRRGTDLRPHHIPCGTPLAVSTQHSALSTSALSSMTDMDHASPSGTEVAVIGMAGRFPGADTLDELWEMIAAGREGITTFGDDELRAAGTPEALLRDPSFVRRLGVLRDVESFDAAFFGYSPREAEVLEPAHRLFLEVAWEALENAGAAPARGSRPWASTPARARPATPRATSSRTPAGRGAGVVQRRHRPAARTSSPRAPRTSWTCAAPA